MNITRETIDDLNTLLKVEVKKADYMENVENVLKDYRKKANVKGFRPGMVPIGLVRKMYGKAVQLDEINKLVADNIHKYLTDEKIDILGDPLPKENEKELTDFDTREDFVFTFELGLVPQFDLNLSKKNKVPEYELQIDKKMKDDYISNYTRRFGEFRSVESSGENDMLRGDLTSLDENGNVIPDINQVEETTLSIDVIKDDKIKKTFLKRKIGEDIDFDLRKAFPNDNEIAGILKMQKEKARDVEGIFRFNIKDIQRFEPALVNQELFDKIYGEGVISSENEFNERIAEEITRNLRQESNYKLMLDLKKLALDKTEIPLPEDFLKRWLVKVNEKTSAEQVEKEFNSFKADLKWQLIRNRVAKENDIKISEEELHDEAERITRYQFRQYGLFYATDDQIHKYAHEMLNREDEARRIADKILEEKATEKLKEMVKLDPKKVTVEEFNKLFE
jgi:trigger factor